MSMVRVQSGISAVACVALLVGCGGGGGMSGGGGGGSMSQQMGFIDKALVADNSTVQGASSANTVDAHLVNPWGIAFRSGGSCLGLQPGHIDDDAVRRQRQHRSCLHGSADGHCSGGRPHGCGLQQLDLWKFGLVHATRWSASGFYLCDAQRHNRRLGQRQCGEYSGTVYSSASGAVYTGLALGQDGSGNYFLYAADFANGKIDVLDHGFNNVTSAGSFGTPTGVPSGYVPFGIQNIPASNGSAQIYVAYAQQNAAKTGAAAGAGMGYIAVFDSAGTLVKLLISGGALNAPWGMAVAPSAFGPFPAGALLVGNFGDGKINADNISSGALMGPLNAPNGTPLQYSGLWGIAFGNGSASQPTTTLFYAAGVNGETDGIYGRIDYGSASSGGGGGGGGGGY